MALRKPPPLFKLALALGLLALTPVTAQTKAAPVAQITIATARNAARQAFAERRYSDSLTLSRALLQRDPADVAALILMAGSQQNLGIFGPALANAKQAYRGTKTKAAKFDAAMIAARSHYGQGQFARAQLWLRRAGDTAPNAQLQAVARRDFRQITQVNPVETRVQFGLAPSSNINNGSANETILINGLPFVLSGDAQALSGTRLSYGLQVKRTFKLASGNRAFIGINMAGRRFKLSPAALAVSGGKTGADYAFSAVEAVAGLSQVGENSRGESVLTLGKNRYGGAPLSTYMRLRHGRAFTSLAGVGMRYAAMAERQLRLDQSLRSATIIGGDFSARLTLPRKDQVQIAYGLRKIYSGSAEIAHVSQTVNLSYQVAKPMLGTRVSFSLGASAKYYARIYLGTLRRDLGLSASISLLLPKYQMLGFAPKIDFTMSRNMSNIGLYDSTQQSISIGIKSTF